MRPQLLPGGFSTARHLGRSWLPLSHVTSRACGCWWRRTGCRDFAAHAGTRLWAFPGAGGCTRARDARLCSRRAGPGQETQSTVRTPVGPIQDSKPEADCAPGRSSACRHAGREDHAAAAAHLALGGVPVIADSAQAAAWFSLSFLYRRCAVIKQSQRPGFPC